MVGNRSKKTHLVTSLIMKKHNSGILSNSYVPPHRPSYISRELSRLSTESLFNLVELWLSLSITQPKITKSQRESGLKQKELITDFKEVLENLKSLKQTSQKKRKLIDRILVDYYPNGLNTLQLAQIDIQSMVDKPSSYSWVSSSAKIATKSTTTTDEDDALDDFIFSLDSQSFLDNLIKNLSNLYLTHIYISRHPGMPLVIIRIQMYEYSHLKKKTIRKNEPNIISRRPFYLIIPTSSNNLIHSTLDGMDVASKLIIQSVEMTLSSNLHQIKLIPNEDHPIKSLNAIHILKGISRFGGSLGSWAPYADGTVDINPLEDSANHMILKLGHKEHQLDSNEEQEDKELKRRKVISNLRFKGTFNNETKSDLLYDTNKPERKNKREFNNEYESIVPVQQFTHKIDNLISSPAKKKQKKRINHNDNSEAPEINLRLFGNDVFAGLHELSVNGVINPEKMPDWLTSLPSNAG